MLGAVYSAYVFMPKRRVIDYDLRSDAGVGAFVRNLADRAVRDRRQPGGVDPRRRARARSGASSTAESRRRRSSPSAGSSPRSRAGPIASARPGAFFLGEFLGVVFLFAGFVVSAHVLGDIRIPFTRHRAAPARRPGLSGAVDSQRSLLPGADVAPGLRVLPSRCSTSGWSDAAAYQLDLGRSGCCSTAIASRCSGDRRRQRLDRTALPDLVPDRRGLDGRLARPRDGVPARADPVRLHLRRVPLPRRALHVPLRNSRYEYADAGRRRCCTSIGAPASSPWRSACETYFAERALAADGRRRGRRGDASLSLVLMAHDARCRAGLRVDPGRPVPTLSVLPGTLRLLTPFLNITGGLALMLGAIFSAYVFMPKRASSTTRSTRTSPATSSCSTCSSRRSRSSSTSSRRCPAPSGRC